MNIYGLQKLTLLDYPGHTACTIFLGGCNFRCPYCHNMDIVEGRTATMDEGDFLDWLESRKGLLEGVCISGGEPTLHQDLPELVRRIKDLGFLVKVDTNGYRPDMLWDLAADYVAMDIKNGFTMYEYTAGTHVALDLIKSSIMLVKTFPDYEFRTTVTEHLHKDYDFMEIGEMIRGAKKYFLQKCTVSPPADEDLKRYVEIMRNYVEHVEVRG